MDGFDRLWLKPLAETLPAGGTCEETAGAELEAFLGPRGARCTLHPREELGESYRLSRGEDGYHIEGGPAGLLYGAYDLIRAIRLESALPEGIQSPCYSLRMLNCWDNMNGFIERGYAGSSLWFAQDRLTYSEDRLRFLGRLLASAHINVLCINNVNVHAPAQRLLLDMLPDAARMAALLRPFGVRLMLSVDFSLPLQQGLPTADPLDRGVAAFWRAAAEKVWQAIPDFAGFLVKADSEHRPGPNAYGRTHAEGANMLARAVAPFGGKVVWRAFVYNCMQDWRDVKTDRPCAAYDLYQPLDGQFDDNVILQIKHGPFDFQVREPVSPLLYGMAHTHKAMELQLAQEYTGQQVDLYAMPSMWQELFEQLPPENVSAIAAVSNLGDSPFWTGHPFAALNLYAYGMLAWQPTMDAARVTEEWVRLTYDLPEDGRRTLCDMLMNSRSVYELYTAPLGLNWMVTPHTHYGPNPDGYEYDAWGTYHRADRNAVGIDRTAAGTGYTAQYPEAIRAQYEDPAACPDKLLLFFHRMRYDDRMRDGRTVIQRIYDDHFEGLAAAERMLETLRALPLPEPDFSEAVRRMERQVRNAREWCDIINTFFYRFSGIPDEHGRTITP